jgi:FkbM family methyltransferase
LIKIYFNKNRIIEFNHSKFPYPILLRNGTSDILTFRQVFFDEEYQMENIDEPHVIIDCGANIGLSTVYFKNKYPNSTIIAIEPEYNNFELLVNNTIKYNDIHCIEGGIWNKSTNLEIRDIGLGNWGFIIEESELVTKNSISAFTIDDIITKFKIEKIDILKIDIEGSEKELFSSNFERWLPKTRVIIIELHDRLKEGCSKSLFSALSNFNYSISFRGENLYIYLNNPSH